jgi:hypothetical protein
VYVLPDSALSGTAALNLAQFDVPALSHSAASASAAVTPYFALHILQIDANDTAGVPAQNALSILLNVDSIQKFAMAIPDIGGVARVAVPVGNYRAGYGLARIRQVRDGHDEVGVEAADDDQVSHRYRRPCRPFAPRRGRRRGR